MDTLKTGKFIGECRKEKNLTQLQLAEKLNITNRAVSKWENGKSMPDASIMLELCNILGITVNELLSGERIKGEDYKEKAEQKMLELQKKEERAIKHIFIVEIIWLIICVALTPVHLAINYYYPDNNGTGIGGLILLCGFVLFIIYFTIHCRITLK